MNYRLTEYYKCERCGECRTLRKMNMAMGAEKDGYYCNDCKKVLQRKVTPTRIVFRPALENPEAKECRKRRL